MANTRYANFVLENKLNEILDTKLSMSQFLTVDNSLQETSGMIKKVNVYTSTGSVEDVAEGQGNSTAIEMSYTPQTYTVTTTQGRFVYTDEDAMTDAFLVDAGLTNLAKEIVNDYNHKAITEMESTSLKVTYPKNGVPTFDNFADAIALLNLEDSEENGFFALVNPAMKATLRKQLADDLKYVEAFSRTGYIGTVCGIPVYTCKDVSAKTIVIANKEAVTAFVKKNTEIAQERDENTRTNTVYGRNVKVIALTDGSKAVKIVEAQA